MGINPGVLDELRYYLLAGAGGEGPAGLMDEACRGEQMGFGTAFISERWNVKEASSLTGAACAVTNRMQIATAATNHNTRHPLITGSWPPPCTGCRRDASRSASAAALPPCTEPSACRR
jgi:hypothetical protein